MIKYTYKNLKEALEKLTPEQLEQKIIVSREDEGILINDLFIIDEDIYVNTDNFEDGGTLAELKEIYGDEFILEDFRLATPKGTVFLSEDF